MKKLLLAAAAACAFAAATPAFAQVSYTDVTPEGARITVPVTPSKPLPTTTTISGGATETTQQSILSELQAQTGILSTPAPSLPPQAPVATSNADVTQLYQSIAASGDTTLVSATASQYTRIQRLECSIVPTSGSVTVTFKSGTNTIRAVDFPSSGGVLSWPYSPYPYVKTNANEALIVNFSTPGAYKCTLGYVKGA